jgi:uncharacterized cupin superfamily protein
MYSNAAHTGSAPSAVLHGSELAFETIGPTPGAIRMHHEHTTLVRVIAGELVLLVGAWERILGPGDEVTVAEGMPHQLWSAGDGEARVVMGFRRVRG